MQVMHRLVRLLVKVFADDEHNVVSNIDGKLLMTTIRNVPNQKLVLIDLLNPKKENWETIIAESKNSI